MKKTIFFFCVLLSASLIFISFVSAQPAGYRGQSINGSTGLFSIPTGRIGWEDSGKTGLDFGYRAVINNDAGIAHIPSVTASLLNWFEISAAFDIQPNDNNLLLGLKIKLPFSASTSISAGVNFQLTNIGVNNDDNAYQPYLAITYPATLFNMSSETTIVIGKTLFTEKNNNSDIDFGMGFDLILFPDVFEKTVHWIIDFANFSYSNKSWPYNSSQYRGILNTGFRIDLSAIPALSNYKLLIDFILNDLFDAGGRSFTIGAVLGFKMK